MSQFPTHQHFFEIGQVCLLHSLAKADKLRSSEEKPGFFLLFNVCGGIILLFYVIYFWKMQVKRFMTRLCPGGKMSCIGKYQRNVLNFTTTAKLALAWGFFPIFRQFVLLAYAHLEERVSPQNVFYIDKKPADIFFNSKHFVDLHLATIILLLFNIL